MTVTEPTAHRVGDISIFSLVDGLATEHARSILSKPDVDGDVRDAHANLLDDGQLELTMGAYLVVTGDRRILIDAGLGMIDNGQYRGGAMLDSLATTGLAPSDITDVIFTHLHFDHVRWATRRGDVVFQTQAAARDTTARTLRHRPHDRAGHRCASRSRAHTGIDHHRRRLRSERSRHADRRHRPLPGRTHRRRVGGRVRRRQGSGPPHPRSTGRRTRRIERSPLVPRTFPAFASDASSPGRASDPG